MPDGSVTSDEVELTGWDQLTGLHMITIGQSEQIIAMVVTLSQE